MTLFYSIFSQTYPSISDKTRHTIKFFFICLAIFISQLANASSNPSSETMYFMGLKNNEWIIVYKKMEDLGFKIIKTESEPRELYFSPNEDLIFYIDAETNLRQVTLTEKHQEEVLFKPSENDLYAQPFWDSVKQLLYLVKMPHGKSSEADIVVWSNGRMKPVIRQISSQFEPYVFQQNWLYYGHVHCSLECGRIIQEIWRKNIISGEAEQISLLGNISRQAIVDTKGEWLYFSSNKQGTYHIWRQALPDTSTKGTAFTKPEQLTKGSVTDTDPALDSQGNLFFIRHQEGKSSLMQKDNNGVIKSITLPEDIREIRNLRINS